MTRHIEQPDLRKLCRCNFFTRIERSADRPFHIRLTGKHETQSIDQYSYGISDRGASIRIPIGVVENGYKGWLEDRRPASNADPYSVSAVIIETVKSAVGEVVAHK